MMLNIGCQVHCLKTNAKQESLEKATCKTYILTPVKLPIKATEFHQNLHTVYEDRALSHTIVFQWVKYFWEGRGVTENNALVCRPVSSEANKAMAIICLEVKKKFKMALNQIAWLYDSPVPTIFCILNGKLNINMICTTWMLQILIPKKHQTKLQDANILSK